MNIALNPGTASFDCAELWLSTLKAAGRRPATLDSYGRAVKMLRDWHAQFPTAGGDWDPATLTKLEARAFTNWLQERYQPGGVLVRVRALRAFYNWLIEDEIVTANPFANLRISVPKEAKTTADDAQVDAMLDHAKRAKRNSRRDLAMLTLLVDTGCRKGELAALTVADFDLSSGTVRFPVSKTTVRTVPLSDRAVNAMARWLRLRGTAGGSVWSVEAPYRLIRHIVQQHSGGALTPHALRRAFAVRWLSKGGSETSLMRLAGWSSLEMIRTYVLAHADTLATDEFRRLMG